MELIISKLFVLQSNKSDKTDNKSSLFWSLESCLLLSYQHEGGIMNTCDCLSVCVCVCHFWGEICKTKLSVFRISDENLSLPKSGGNSKNEQFCFANCSTKIAPTEISEYTKVKPTEKFIKSKFRIDSFVAFSVGYFVVYSIFSVGDVFMEKFAIQNHHFSSLKKR